MAPHGDAPTGTVHGEGVNEMAAGDRALSRSLPDGWPRHEDVDPLRLNASDHRPYWSGWSRGYDEGFTRGRREGWRLRVEHEQRAFGRMSRSIKAAGGPFSLSYDEIERRRRQMPEGYVPRPVPSFEECMRSWEVAA